MDAMTACAALVVPSSAKDCRADSLHHERDQRTAATARERKASAEPVTRECGSASDEQVPALKDTVDEQLDDGVGDVDGVEHLGEIVQDTTVAGPLREEGERQQIHHRHHDKTM